jgi:hypothetical protein
MLGTLLLIGMLVCGFLNVTPWVLIPGAIAAGFLGMHYPPGKATAAKLRGLYWKGVFGSMPLQAIFLAILYGVGWGIGALIG